MTDADRWSAVKGWLDRALEQPLEGRRAWLAAQAMSPRLRDEVVSLLESSERASGFLEGSPLDQPGAAAAVRHATEAFADQPLESGYRLGPYQIVKPIGEGGMGTVYLAARADEAFEKHVAIKLVRLGGSHRILADRLRQERRVLAVLEHPNIARLLDGGTTPAGVPYVVMEHVDGVPIDVFCDERDLNVVGRVRLLQGVCHAVHHAHAHLIVHRDIKASNILVTRDGQPKLLDFGIAKVLAEDPAGAAVTAIQAMTPESASPEQLRHGVVTVASDIYALGALLYRLLTGQSPYPASANVAEMLSAIESRDPRPPSAVAAPARARQIARDLDLIVLKALRREPERRYESAAALADDLDRLLAQRPVRAVPDSSSYRMRRFVGRHRLGVGASVAAVLALAVGLATTLWQFRVAQVERARAERRFAEVRQLANTVIFDLHDAIAALPGSTSARGLLIQNALTYLDSLAAEASGDLPLQRELARAYERLGIVQGLPGMANLGDRDSARTSLDKTIGLLQTIVRDPSATTEDRVMLARLFNRRSTLEADFAVKMQRIADGVALLDGLSAADQQTRPVLATRASLVWAEGGARAGARDIPGARDNYGEAVKLFAQVLETSNAENLADNSRNLSIALKNYGAALSTLGDHTLGIEQYRRAEVLDRDRVTRDPTNTTWQLDLSYSLASLASSERQVGRLDEAVRHYEQALELRQGVLKVDPVNDQAEDAVARAHETLAMTLNQRGDRARALESALAAVRARERRATARPAEIELRNQLIDSVGTLYNVRVELAKAAHGADARQAWQDARAAIARVAQLQDETSRAGAKRVAGPDRAALAREIAQCDAALASLR